MITKDEVRWRGVSKVKPAVHVEGKTFIIHGRFLKTARLKQQWEQDLDHPADAIRALKCAASRIDMLRFWQRIPDSEVRHQYYNEQREIAAIPVSTFDHWWKKQVNTKTRNMVRKSKKLGVTIEEVEFSDELVRGIVGVFSESPVRRGKPFWHYGKNFETVKREMSADLDRAIFIGAHHGEELIGFIKLLLTNRYATITLILDKRSHRDKSPMNGMIAKAVEICANRRIPYITYTVWRRGDHGEFQKRNGFERIPVPEYFVPLTLRGRLALQLGLHKGIKGALPENWMIRFLALRSRWYTARYSRRLMARARSQESATASV